MSVPILIILINQLHPKQFIWDIPRLKIVFQNAPHHRYFPVNLLDIAVGHPETFRDQMLLQMSDASSTGGGSSPLSF